EWTLQGRLDDLTGKHSPHRIRAVHLELPATHGGLHCHTLLAIEKLTLADTSRPRHGDEKQHETIRFHACPPSAPILNQNGASLRSDTACTPRRSHPGLAPSSKNRTGGPMPGRPPGGSSNRSRLKVAPFCSGGYSRKVCAYFATSCLTKACGVIARATPWWLWPAQMLWADQAGRRALGPRGEPLGRQRRPGRHHVLGVAPLPLRRRRDRAAADTTVDSCNQNFAGRRVGELELRLCAAHEWIGSGRAALERAQEPRLRNHHGDGPQAGRRRGDVGDRHLELHDVRTLLLDNLELLGQLLVQRGVEKVHEPLLILGRDLRL